MTTAIVATPYGRDTSCTDYLRTGRIVSGAELLGEAAYRRLITTRGTLEDDQNYGYNISDKLGTQFDDIEIAALEDGIKGELGKDDRLDSVAVTIVVDRSISAAFSLLIDITGTGKDGNTFKLVMHADDTKVELLELEAL